MKSVYSVKTNAYKAPPVSWLSDTGGVLYINGLLCEVAQLFSGIKIYRVARYSIKQKREMWITAAV